MMENLTTDQINAISQLWKPIAALLVPAVFILFMFLFRKPIGLSIENLKKIILKQGGTEFSLEKDSEEHDNAIQKTSDEATSELNQKNDEDSKIQEATSSQKGDFFISMINSIQDRKFEEANSHFKTLQNNETNAIKRVKNEIIYRGILYKNGHGQDELNELIKIKNDYSDNIEVKVFALSWIASCYKFSVKFEQAIGIYKEALDEKISDEEKINLTSDMAKCMNDIGLKPDALKEIAKFLNNIKQDDLKAKIYITISNILDVDQDPEIRAITLNKVLEFKPGDQEILFDAAYSLSHANFSELSAINYDTLLKFNPKHSSALNNMGVEFSKLEMPFKSTEYYKLSAKEDSTLAMSNLAYKLIDQGFEEEALSILNKAKDNDNPHRNVNTALADLKGKNEKENEALSLIESLAIKQTMFFWEYADAYFKPILEDLSIDGEWISDSNNIFTVTRKGKTIKAIWENDKKGMKCEGDLINNASKIKFQEKKTGYSLLDTEPKWEYSSKDGYLYINPEKNIIKIYVKDLNNLFLELKK